MHEIYVVFHPEDQEYFERLATVLDPDIRANRLRLWSRDQIPTGADVALAQAQAIERAQLALVLATPNCIADDEIATKILPALAAASQAGNLRRLWAAIRSTNYEPLAEFMPLNQAHTPLQALSEAEQDEVWLDISRKLRELSGIVPQEIVSTPITSPSEAYEVRLVVDRDGAEPRAHWVQDNNVGKPFTLPLPLDADNLKQLRWYLETYPQYAGTGDRARARNLEIQMDQWACELFDAAFGNREGYVAQAALEAAIDDKRPCLLTLSSDDPDVLGQPWELMRNDKAPLALQGVIIRRQLRGAKPWRGGRLALPLRILLIVSRPSDVDFIDPRNSIAPLLDALDSLPIGQAIVDFCDPPTLARLEKVVSAARTAKAPYHIVHFDGHGTYLPKTGVGALCFENEEGRNHLVRGRDLGDLMARFNVPLVLLEACRGSDLSHLPVFGSVAPALLRAGVGSAVAFSHSVHIEAARLLVARFYAALAQGKSVGGALEEGRCALLAKPARFLGLGPDPVTVDLRDWFIVQLYQAGPDPVLVRSASVATPTHTPRRIDLPGFPPPPLYRFHGRARELLELERDFRDHPSLVLVGMGGMGKTALAREAAAWWHRTGRIETAVFCSFERYQGVAQVVQALGTALEGPGFSAQGEAEQRQRAIALFAERAVLLVWDNFESTLATFQETDGSAQVTLYDATTRAELNDFYRDLIAGSPQGRLLVTCRPKDTGLPGIVEQSLEGLTEPDALHLLATVLARKKVDVERAGYDRGEVVRLLAILDWHPLSIELVAPHLAILTPKQIQCDFARLLKEFTEAGAVEGRNRSLQASLAFSRSRLGPAAQAILPWLAWFQGGVFEENLLAFTEMPEHDWVPIRDELTATALIALETVPGLKPPFLRFHPTLSFAAQPEEVHPDVVALRFVAVCGTFSKVAEDVLRGRQPEIGMILLAREEANQRRAIQCAFTRDDRQRAWFMANTLRFYLQLAGRPRERDVLMDLVKQQMGSGHGLDEAGCAAILHEAWSRFTQGHATEAVSVVEDLIAQLKAEQGDIADPSYELALSFGFLGRILCHAGRPDLALDPMRKSIAGFENLGEVELDNLATSLGDLAMANQKLGLLDEGLIVAKRSLEINRQMGRDQATAAALVQIGLIKVEQYRFEKAEAVYDEAQVIAERVGDQELQGLLFQNRGTLRQKQGDDAGAVTQFRKALTFFQGVGNKIGEMQTCNNLGVAEKDQDNLDAAQAWHKRTHDLALALKDQAQRAATSLNFGALYQTRAERAKNSKDREREFRRSLTATRESLAISLEMRNEQGAAKSYFLLGQVYRHMEELDLAEVHLKKGLAINEKLGLPDVYMDYGELAELARDRGNEEEAASWQAKRETKVAELQQNRGRSPANLPNQLMQDFNALAQAVHAACVSASPLPPEAAEALAQLAEMPPPMGPMAVYLRDIAAGENPHSPDDLPAPLQELLQALRDALPT